jgi:hypothetical protein
MPKKNASGHKLFPKISTDESSSRVTAGELHESTSASSPGSLSELVVIFSTNTFIVLQIIKLKSTQVKFPKKRV